jgi:hypothetical protein
MQLGLRAILLVVAIILFIIAAVTNGDTAFDLLVFGLACIAAAFIADELGAGSGGRFSGGRRSDA